MQLTMKDLDANMVFSIIVGVVVAIITAPFIFAWVMLNESLGSLEATSRSDDAPTKDDRDTFGRRPGDSFYGYTVNDVTVLSEMGSDAERSGLFRDTL